MTLDTPFTEEQLMSGLAEQSPRVIDYLYKKAGPMAVKMIARYGGNHADAEDIFQESILAAYVNIKKGKYQPSEQAKLTTYILQICKFKWLDQLKSAYRKNTEYQVPDTDIEDLDPDELEQEARIQQLYKLIEQLGEQCKSILQLFYWKKFSVEKIAESMGLEPASAKNQKYRCMKRLKEMAERHS